MPAKTTHPGRFIRNFLRREDGSATIETVMWIPVFVWLLALVVNVSMILFEKNQAYRIIQDANRTLSTGYLQDSTQVEEYIRTRLAGIAPDATITATIENGVVKSEVSYQVADLLLPHAVKQLLDVWIKINAEHYVEY